MPKHFVEPALTRRSAPPSPEGRGTRFKIRHRDTLANFCLRVGLVVEQLTTMKAKRFDEIFVGPMSPLRNLFLENVRLLGSLRNVGKIRDQIFDLIFSITTAERAAIFVDHTLTTRGRENREESVSINRAIIDRVLKSGPGVLVNEPPTSILCLPMDTLVDRVGVIYAESSNPQKPLYEVNYDMLTGVAVIVAMAVDHVSIVELLRADNTRLKEEGGSSS